MQGHFNAMVIDDLGLGDAPFLEAIKKGDLDGLLKRHPIVARASTPNQVFQPLAEAVLYHVFGLPATYAFGSIPGTGMRCVALSKLSSEPAFLDHTGGSSLSDDTNANNDQWSHGPTLYKQFDEHKSEPTRIWVGTDREAYYFRDRFLWLPSEGAFTDIRSINCYGDEDADRGYSSYYGKNTWKVSRTRLKDSGGSPITLQKTVSQGFLVEYIVKLFSR